MKKAAYALALGLMLTLFACEGNADNNQTTGTETIDSLQNTTEITTADNQPDAAPTTDATPTPTVTRKASFEIVSSTVFEPQNKKIVFLEDSLKNKLILFRTDLQVNTDGSPLSYHPQDLRGKTKAINNIANAIAVYKGGQSGNIIFNGGYSEAMAVFEQYRDSDYEKVPDGYRIKWNNVLIAEKVNGVVKPCIFKTGKYKGYYSSATSLKNGLTTNKGECDCNNQVNSLEVPGFVLVGGRDNPLRNNGARVGDLLVAFNPVNKAVSYAIINDVGPAKKLGEGTVLLNMQLNKKTEFPKNKNDAYKLVTKEAIIAIIPGSRKYQSAKPFTAENIKRRIESWLNENGFAGEANFVQLLQKSEARL